MLLTSFVGFAQKFQGKAIYESLIKVKIEVSVNGNTTRNTSEEKELQKKLKKQLGQKTFTLNFDKRTSSYKKDAELEVNNSKFLTVLSTITSSNGSDVLYKNIKENIYLNQKELMGKRFLIADTLPKSDWKLTSETKKIGNYTCYKATKSKEIEQKSFMVVDGDQKETKKKKTIVTTAWYTPQIPISNGPAMYGGLPGLILEVSEGNKTILCKELILNPKKSVEIEKPTKGKKVNQKEFYKIQNQKFEEFVERFRSRKSKKDKNDRSISIEID